MRVELYMTQKWPSPTLELDKKNQQTNKKRRIKMMLLLYIYINIIQSEIIKRLDF